MSNAETVAAIYAAYERGDVEGVLARMAEDVTIDDWAGNSAQLAGVPWMAVRRGKDAAREFFREAESIDVRRMEIGPPLGSGRTVAVEVEVELGNPAVVDSECHVWQFDDDGRVTGLRHYLDTAKHIAASGRSWPPDNA